MDINYDWMINLFHAESGLIRLERIQEFLAKVNKSDRAAVVYFIQNDLKRDPIAALNDTVLSQMFCYNDKISSITLPANIVNIEEQAFAESSLEEIKIEGNVKEIPQGCFARCQKLKKVVLPNSIIKIADAAFMGCTSLESIEIPASIEDIGIDVFANGNPNIKVIFEERKAIDFHTAANKEFYKTVGKGGHGVWPAKISTNNSSSTIVPEEPIPEEQSEENNKEE